MARLKIKTRTNSDPFGKPKVYFAAHPRDFAKYFSELSELIFEYSDSVIFYKDPELDYSDMEHLSDVEEMQLVVAPISSKLLTDSTSVLNEINFAREKRIPILPIMVEVGLTDIFNKAFTNLQYVDKTSKDPTSISFDKKIEMFLSSVLINDELSEKIRAAFDAYVFLSYRKKDREHAQKLMRLVHKNPECRDIAIWYDEFLIAGEDFNHSIKRALCKSDLFLLAVTPNLVNEHNYVEEVEYPMAIEEGKPVLPVEMVPTDKGSLSDRFKDIPSSTPAEAELISKNLILAIERVALRKNDSPEHTYFIGLAYLSGIDVEVNLDMANELITEAAEAGLYEAVDRLVTMYRKGIGVARSYESALKWEARKNSILEERYKENSDYDNFSLLLEAYIQNADHERDLYKYDVAKEKYLTAIEFAKSSEHLKNAEHRLTDVYIRLGDIQREEMKYSDAEKSYHSALSLCEALSSSDDRGVKLLAACYDRLGDVMLAEGHSHDALASYKKALDIAKDILNDGSIDDKRLLCDLYYSQGRAFYEEGLYEQALTSVDRASSEIYSLLIATRDFDLMRDILKYDMFLAEMYLEEGDLANASHKVHNTMICSEKLIEVFDDINSHLLHIKTSDMECTLDRLQKNQYSKIEYVIENHEKLLEEFDVLSEENVTPSIAHDMVVCAINYATTLREAKKIKDADEMIDHAWQMAMYNAMTFPGIMTKLDMANAYCEFAKTARTYKDAIEYYEQSILIYQQLLSETDLSGINLSLIKVLNRLGIMYYQTKEMERSKQCFIRASKIAKELLAHTDSSTVKREYTMVLSNLRTFESNAGNFDAALPLADEAIKYINDFTTQINTEENRLKLHKAYDNKAYICKKLGNVELMNESIRLSKYNKELAERIKNSENVANATAIFNTLDQVLRNGDYAKAEEMTKACLLFSLDIDKELLPYPGQLAMTLEKLAHVYELKGEREKAKKHLADAKHCRLGGEAEAEVRKRWREPYAEMYEKEVDRMLLRMKGSDYTYVKECIEKAIAARELIAEDDGSTNNKIALAEMLRHKGHVLYNEATDTRREGYVELPVWCDWQYKLYDVPKSRECFLRADKLSREAVSERGNKDDIIALAKSLGDLSSRVAKDEDEGEKIELERFEMLNGIYGGSFEKEDLLGLADAYYRFALFRDRKGGDYRRAGELYEKCAQIYKELLERYPDPKYDFYYKNTYFMAKDSFKKANDAEGINRCMEIITRYLIGKADALTKKVKDAGTADEWSDLISIYHDLAESYEDDVAKQEYYLTHALNMSLEFEKRLKVIGASTRVANYYDQLSDVFASTGRLSEAIEYEKLAVEKYDFVLRTSGDNENYKNQRRYYLKNISKLYRELGDNKLSEEYQKLADEA